MRVSSFFLFAAIATETVGAQGIFYGRNDGKRVRALVEEVSMSADLSLSFSFGGIVEPGSSGGGKAGKGGSMMSMGKAGKVMGKAGKQVKKTTTTSSTLP
jgi:hypothetical protein